MPDITGQYEIDTTQTTVNPNLYLGRVALFNEDGTPFTGGGSSPAAATTTTAGVVKQAAATGNILAADGVASAVANAVAAAGDAPTKAEYDAVVALVNDLKAKNTAQVTLLNELKTKLGQVLTRGRDAGQIATS